MNKQSKPFEADTLEDVTSQYKRYQLFLGRHLHDIKRIEQRNSLARKLKLSEADVWNAIAAAKREDGA